jgi:hypothetical protein
MMTPLRDRISALEQQLAQTADNALGRQGMNSFLGEL